MVNEHMRGRVSRRAVLRLGSLGVLGLAVPELISTGPAEAASTRACILLYMEGGPSHLDTFDPKPEAPSEYRGEFRAIGTNVDGIQFCEHLPRLAKLADRLAILRSVTHSETSHEGAHRQMLLGCPAAEAAGSTRTKSAFTDSSHSTLSVRPGYGTHRFGRDCLAACRRIEAGERLVVVRCGGWDTHGQNFSNLRERQLPVLDQGFSGLITDLEQRGLLDTTLVMWMGDFGRTPRINAHGGRDHHPRCQTAVLAGGGIRGGQVIGASGETGSRPIAHPVSPAELAALRAGTGPLRDLLG